jgi:hypothetical protein
MPGGILPAGETQRSPYGDVGLSPRPAVPVARRPVPRSMRSLTRRSHRADMAGERGSCQGLAFMLAACEPEVGLPRSRTDRMAWRAR